MGFISGFLTATVLLLVLASKVTKKQAKDGLHASATWNSKKKRWMVRGELRRIAKCIEFEETCGKPGSVEYLD
jgi:hypothetical protein